MKRRLIAIFFILLAAGFTAALRLLSSPWVENAIRQNLVTLARDRLGVGLVVGRMDHNLLLTRLSLSDVSLTDLAAAGKTISARRLELVFDVFSPLRGVLGIREIRLEGVDLAVERRESGRVVLDPLFPFWERGGRPAGRSLPVRVGSISLLDANVSYEDRPLGLSASLQGVMIGFRRRILDPEGHLQVRFSARAGMVSGWVLPPGEKVSLQTLQGDFVYTPEEIRVTSLFLAGGPLEAAISGRLPLGAGSLEGTVKASLLLDRLPWKTGFSGQLTLEGRAGGTLEKPEVAGRLACRRLSGSDRFFEQVGADFSLAQSGAHLSRLTGLYRGERLTGEMRISFAAGFPFRLQSSLAGYPLEKLLAEFTGRPPVVTGDVSATARAEGHLAPDAGQEVIAVGLDGVARLVLDAVSSAEFSLSLAGGYLGRTLSLERFTAGSGSLLLSARGLLENTGPRLDLVLRDPNLAAWSASTGWRRNLGGALDLRGSLAGTWEELKGGVDGKWSSPAWDRYRADLIQAHLDLDKEGLVCPMASLRAGKSLLSLSARLPWPGGKKGARISLSTSASRLEDILPPLGILVQAEGDLAGSFEAGDAFGAWEGKGEITLRNVRAFGEEADSARVQVVLSGPRLLLDPVTLERKGRQLAVKAALERGRFTVSGGTVGGFPLEEVHALAGLKVPLAGEAEASFQAQGALDAISLSEGTGTVKWTKVSFEKKPWQGGSLSFRLAGRNLSFQGSLLDGRLTARGSAGLTGELPFSGDIAGEKLSRDDLNNVFDIGLPATVSGEVTASAVSEGFLKKLDSTRVAGTIERASFSVKGLPFETLQSASFTYNPIEGVSFRDLRLRSGESSIGGAVKIGKEKILEGTMKGEMDLAGFPFLKPTVDEFSGKCRLELKAGGTLELPRLDGYIEFSGISLSAHLPFLLPCRNLVGRIEIVRDRLRFSRITGEVGEGRVEMEGDLFFEGLAPVKGQLTWTGEGVTVHYPEGLTTRDRARITLALSEGKGTVRGLISADEGSFRQNVDLDNLIALIGESGRTKAGPEPAAGEKEDWLSLDLEMETANPLEADLKVLRGKASGALRLQGKASRPILSGRLGISEGTLEYRGHVFPVTQGWVGFFNPRIIEPSFDVRGRTKVNGLDGEGRLKEYLVDLSASGTPSKLALNLYSDPPLSQVDVISLLTFGAVSRRLVQNPSGIPAVEATLLLTYQLKGRIETGVEKLIGFERFVIDPSHSTPTGSRDVWVEVNKSLGERLYLTYATPVRSSAEHEVQLRYRVTEVFSILGVQKGEQELGLDLDFSFEIP